MKHNRIADRGQVLIIFVFAVVGLIGMTGLAIDGGMIFSDRRHAQNAADTAALSAALQKVEIQRGMQHGQYSGYGDCTVLTPTPTTCGAHVILAALNMAQKNGYTTGVQIHIPPQTGPYSLAEADGTFNPYDYVEVTIDTTVNTFFAKVLGIQQLHNHVQAVARSYYYEGGGLYGGNTLVSLKPGGDDCSGDFDLGGNSSVSLYGGGIFINSNNSCAAFKEESNCVTLKLYYDDTHPMYPVYDAYGKIVPGMIYDPNGNIVPGPATIDGVAGAGSQISSCTNAPTVDTGHPQYQFPPYPPPINPPPAECSLPATGNARNHQDGDGYDHLYPGHYTLLPPAKNTRLYPGVYCIDNLVKVTNPQSHLLVQRYYGTEVPGPSEPPADAARDGVLLYIREGGTFDFQGGQVNLQASGYDDDPYKGYLIFQEHDFTGWDIGDSAPNCQINGNSLSTFKGTIYAPWCDVTINGTSDATGFQSQIIAYTLNLSGDTALEFHYNADDQGTQPESTQLGITH